MRGWKPASRQEFGRDYKQEGDDDYAYGAHGYQQLSSTSGLAHSISQPPGFNTTVNSSITALDKSSGRTGGMDTIEWAKWDVLGDR
jgi:hypothetical protein